MKLLCVSIQMKAIEQYFHVVLFIMLYKVVLTFKLVDETLVCDHSNESYGAVLSCGNAMQYKQTEHKYRTLSTANALISASRASLSSSLVCKQHS